MKKLILSIGVCMLLSSCTYHHTFKSAEIARPVIAEDAKSVILLTPLIDDRHFKDSIGRGPAESHNYFSDSDIGLYVTMEMAGFLRAQGKTVVVAPSAEAAGIEPDYIVEGSLKLFRMQGKQLGFGYAFNGYVRYLLRCRDAKTNAVLFERNIKQHDETKAICAAMWRGIFKKTHTTILNNSFRIVAEQLNAVTG